jgi:hypothetical protein
VFDLARNVALGGGEALRFECQTVTAANPPLEPTASIVLNEVFLL